MFRATLPCIAAATVALGACGPPETGTSERRINVLLVTLDTLRADRLGCYGNERIETPHIDALAAEGTLFENAFSPVPVTLPSHCSIMTGTYPARHGVHDNGIYVLDDEAVTLAEQLGEQGFATAAFVSAFVLEPQFNLSQGFDVYDAELDLPLSDEAPELPPDADAGARRWAAQLSTRYQRRADAVTDRALAWLAEAREAPFLLWVHYFDAHEPYQAPEPWTTRYDPDYTGPMDGAQRTYAREAQRGRAVGPGLVPAEDWRHMVARYDGEVSFVDAQLGRLLDALRSSGAWEETLIVVVGDHGESFGEHGVQLWNHPHTVFDEVIRVPLIVRRPDGVGAGRRVSGLVRTIDVAPTVLDWLALPNRTVIDGRSLLPLTESEDAEAPGEILVQALRGKQLVLLGEALTSRPHWYLGLRTGQFKLVLKLDRSGEVEEQSFYDLAVDAGEADPTPLGEAAAQLPAWVELLRSRDAALVHEGSLAREAAEPVRELDQLTSDALRALGYVD